MGASAEQYNRDMGVPTTPSSDWGRGSWMQTFTGLQFFPLDPKPEDIDPVDIAHALAYTCRYGGHTKRYYSVAEHTVLVSRWLEAQGASVGEQLAGLLHDAAEAYVGDMVRPLKHHMPEYRVVEDRVLDVIFEKYRLPFAYTAAGWPRVAEADNRILLDERDELLSVPPQAWEQEGLQPLGVTVTGWGPSSAEQMWVRRFAELTD